MRIRSAAVACLVGLIITACAAGPMHTPAPAPAPDAALTRALGTEVAQFTAADQASPPAACRVLFVGSSSIRMWTTLSEDMAPLPVINRGFGGSHIEHVNRWFDALVAVNQPSAIVLYAGENDVADGKTTQRVLADFAAFMKRKTAALGDTPVYFISLKPSKLRFGQLAQQSEVNAAIRKLAAKRADLQYIDVASPMLADGKPRDLFAPDDLHMTRDGYAIWTRKVRAALLPHARADASRCLSRPRLSLP